MKNKTSKPRTYQYKFKDQILLSALLYVLVASPVMASEWTVVGSNLKASKVMSPGAQITCLIESFNQSVQSARVLGQHANALKINDKIQFQNEEEELGKLRTRKVHQQGQIEPFCSMQSCFPNLKYYTEYDLPGGVLGSTTHEAVWIPQSPPTFEENEPGIYTMTVRFVDIPTVLKFKIIKPQF